MPLDVFLSDPAPAAVGFWPPVIVAVGTALAAVATALRVRSARNGTDNVGLKQDLVQLRKDRDADAERLTRVEDKVDGVEDKVDQVLIALATASAGRAPDARPRSRPRRG